MLLQSLPQAGSARRAHEPAARHRYAGGRSCVTSRPVVAHAVAAPTEHAEDKWIARTLAPLAGVAVPPSLSALNRSSLDALRTMRMPTTRNEDYRFTDLAMLMGADVAAAAPGAAVDAAGIQALALEDAANTFAVVVDGVLRPELSHLSGVPAGVYVGPLSGAPAALAARLGELAASRGGPFATLNGASVRDALVVDIPDGVAVSVPLHVLYVSTPGAGAAQLAGSAPRLLLRAGEHSTVEVLEEFCGAPGTESGHYFCSSVTELLLDEDSDVTHGYVQREAPGAVHIKATLVRQAASSTYTLNEARVGGALSRHDLGVEQVGEDTHTDMRHFIIAGAGQTHDLHSKLVLDHPRGVASQLHKCIVAHASGRGVFDGNVRVNKRAQQSDAKQLSRNLLLVPRATVNVKPNLQIVADDVKCTHGCAVSDLRDDELFYFRARGIDAVSARRALVASFGAEVTQRLKYKPLLARIKASVDGALVGVLDDVNAAAAASSAE
ncbi:hypothetical protein FOA52_015498 [Chlamydomonas sp. UWO 241]|nr:hypothetical protein FOA52_015498 [Chlamydomonas sp. UWO 241]